MESPSSTRRVTRSQAFDDSKLSFSSNKTDDSGICQRKKKKAQEEDRCALIDITNDSPIVGLAMQTPPSGFMCKRRNSRINNTPGSGEALLRGQVKTLLHKGTELTHSITSLPFIHLLAPTPANTPQFPNFEDHQVQIKIASPVVARYLSVILDVKEEKSISITRSLLLDFTDKSESSEEEEDEEFHEQICVVYNNEDEEMVEAKEVKGIPTPRGKYLRFATQEDEESSSSSTH